MRTGRGTCVTLHTFTFIRFPSNRVNTPRLPLFADQVSVCFPPNRTDQFLGIRLSSHSQERLLLNVFHWLICITHTVALVQLNDLLPFTV
jgi:hypothetical protein